jgi:hypothetical protein
VFPLLEAVASVAPGSSAKATVDSAATLEFAAPGDSYKLNIQDQALGVSDVTLHSTAAGLYEADLGGGEKVTLNIADPSTSGLSWSTFGVWNVAMADGTSTQAAFIAGYKTIDSDVPKTGYAAYFGKVAGEVIHPGSTLALTGDATLSADFSSGTITGDLANMMAGSQPWNSVSLIATISGASFDGTAAASSAPINAASLSASATGTVNGIFFGPHGEEIGAVWSLSDGVGTAIGTIGTKYDKWGY